MKWYFYVFWIKWKIRTALNYSSFCVRCIEFFKNVFSNTDGRLEGTHWIEMSLKMVELRAHVVF